MPFHEQLLQYLVTGLTTGAIYALLNQPGRVVRFTPE